MKIAPQHPDERFFELGIGHRVTKRINRRIQIAHIITRGVQPRGHHLFIEPINRGQNVKRRPKHHERSQNERDRPQCLFRSILGFGFALAIGHGHAPHATPVVPKSLSGGHGTVPQSFRGVASQEPRDKSTALPGPQVSLLGCVRTFPGASWTGLGGRHIATALYRRGQSRPSRLSRNS
jgi:hypothetical protein